MVTALVKKEAGIAGVRVQQVDETTFTGKRVEYGKVTEMEVKLRSPSSTEWHKRTYEDGGKLASNVRYVFNGTKLEEVHWPNGPNSDKLIWKRGDNLNIINPVASIPLIILDQQGIERDFASFYSSKYVVEARNALEENAAKDSNLKSRKLG